MHELIETYLKNTCKHSHLYLFKLTENINKHKTFINYLIFIASSGKKSNQILFI